MAVPITSGIDVYDLRYYCTSREKLFTDVSCLGLSIRDVTIDYVRRGQEEMDVLTHGGVTILMYK